MARTVFRVLPSGKDWILTWDGSDRHSCRFLTKRPAIVGARHLARANRPSRLVIYNQDGRIALESTYGGETQPPEA